ncbi:hypothetical protein PYW07_000055 [Mythimna separata]|uniref:Laminin subunit alpha n=1 Tax=Mythimna separata TaxID=271217 RepID=A0AAD7Z353_MYTSE|nr:hypothetical protein PYW07_000055 [Mythimna separata]
MIPKSSLYRMVLKYANPLQDVVFASIVITPDSVVDIQQKFNVALRPTVKPQLVTVAGDKGVAPSPFVMNPGNWMVTIKTNKEVMIDYFVLIPEAYYEATVLTQLVERPCVIGDRKLCRHFAYPSLFGRPTADVSGLSTSVSGYIDDVEQLNELQASAESIPILTDDEIQYNMKIDPPGAYIIIIEYVTPINRTVDSSNEIEAYNSSYSFVKRSPVTVRFQSGDQPETDAIVNLNDCPYTAPCRQAVVDDLSKIQVFNIHDANNIIYLMGDRDTLVGIKSIVAVPESEWHLDYITPRPYCLRRNGKCAPSLFTAAVDSKKLEVESGTGGDRDIRPPFLDNTTAVVYLAPEVEPLKIESKMPAPGDYMFLVHYYQPVHPESSLDAVIKTDSQQFDTTMQVQHCPSSTGCRSLLKLADVRQFPVAENFTITFLGNNSKGLWIDYVLIIAAPDFVDAALTEANVVDYTREFIEKCAYNHFHIPANETGFCRDAMFSITAEYNSGALACVCDFMGSTELECNTFGGQCPCKPNVIGRSCTACRTGYYGFPNCRPCHCPSTAICDDNGMCICPKNVEGENCDRCKPYTFNFDVQRGCDDCNCNPLGVVDNRLQCEADSGNCACRENVVGRTCDHCVPGHYAFPECVPCTCERDGTTDDVCDQGTAQCYCKRYVTGQACNTCVDEYFNLQPSNPEGCTKCYCFGKTTRCASSYLSWAGIDGMSDWYLVNVEANKTLNIFPRTLAPVMVNDSVITADLVGDDSGQKVVYFGAPDYYLGKRLTSYGGYLTYSIYYQTGLDGGAIAAADVILGGSDGYLVHNSVEQPPSLTSWMHAVRLSEDEFSNADGSPVSREQFMNTLVNVTSIYIRATYWDQSIETSLIAVTLDIGVEEYDEFSRRASSVEECQCPKAYRGLSCEQCAEGYYRLSSGSCVPCQCNGHSRECDVNTGVCLECTDNTMGDHCEQCIPGYHGDATVGTMRDCLICACPMPYVSNNFAIGCDLSENGSLISCQCKPGYGGARCEFCAAGYYGVPELIGDHCKPCNCSGNINPNDPGSCDSITGDCLKCVNNTAGAACNLCAPGFYGDAIFSKNCTACSCDEFGMERCDPATGTCVCRPGVIGARCDQCSPNHYGLNSGQGCTPCDCGIASESAQCDHNTGQCNCSKGVTGKHCDQCAAGYWNYTKEGCDHCNCNTGYSLGFTCNATGQCECLPGVVGEKCDRCPVRWVLIPGEGCLECDSCTDALLFTIEDMSALLANETKDFKDKADSFFTTQRLNYIANQTKLLQPRVAELKNVDVADVTAAVKTLENSAKNLLRSAEFAATDSDKQITRAADIAADADKTLASVRDSSEQAKAIVKHVRDLATGLELSQQPKVDSALAEARQIKGDIAASSLRWTARWLRPGRSRAILLVSDGTYYNSSEQEKVIVKHVRDLATGLELSQQSKVDSALAEARQIKGDIAAKDLAPKKLQADGAFVNATKQIERMNVFVQPVNEQAQKFHVLVNDTRDLKDKLDEMLQYTDLAQHTAATAEQLNAKNRQSKFGNKVTSVTKLNTAAMTDLIDAGYDIGNATFLNIVAAAVVDNSTKALGDIGTTNQDLVDRLADLEEKTPELRNLTDVAYQHTSNLRNRADNLRYLAERENNNSRTQHAYTAASAYSSIVTEIGDAKKAADDAEQAVKNITQLSERTTTQHAYTAASAYSSIVTEIGDAKKAADDAEQAVKNITQLHAYTAASAYSCIVTEIGDAKKAADDAEQAVKNITQLVSYLSTWQSERTTTQHAYTAASAYSCIVTEIGDAKKAADDAEQAVKNITQLVSYLSTWQSERTTTQHAYTAASAYSSIVTEIGDAKKAADVAEQAVKNITQLVSYLSTWQSERTTTQHAYTAASAYSSIVTEIGDAKKAADDAEQAVKNITQLSERTTTQHAYTAASAYSSIVTEIGDAKKAADDAEQAHAYTAASAYSSIVTEIGDAKKAADDAEQAVKNITQLTNELNSRVVPARDRSSRLVEAATKAQTTVEQALSPNLTRAELQLQQATRTKDSADDDNNAIMLSLPKPPPPFSLADEVLQADKVDRPVKATLDIMSQLGPELAASKEWAQTLPKLADDAQKMTSNLDNLVKDIEKLGPKITQKYRTMKVRQDDLERRCRDADDKLIQLKELIEKARTLANRIQVGVEFDSHTTLQPRLPDTVDEMSTSTHVSVYFKTNETNGLILYLGNPKDTNLRRTKSDDFMVIGVENGYPYLKMDIGDSAESGREPARIGSDKFVADNRWYQVVVDRVGRNVKLSIREPLDNGSADYVHSKEAVLPGQHTIFNLDKDKSKLYVGGAPSDAKLQSVIYPAFVGQIEELMIGDTPVGLWNFASAQKLKGARQRDKLLPRHTGPMEYRFNGRSHVTMPAEEYQTPEMNQVLLFFRTYAPDGLIYLVGEGASFFSIQMQDGKVYLQVSLGNTQDLLIIGTENSYNDGKWHRLDAARIKTKCSLKVDREIIKMDSSATEDYIYALDTMNFGGNNKGILEVTRAGFDGCMRQISMNSVNIDLSQAKESIGIAYGCQFANLVSLSGKDSYLRYVNITTENLQLTLKFKTSSPDGLLFMYVSRTQTAAMSDSISLSLIKGKLVLMSQREQLDTGLNTYNDSQWHVLTVTHNNNALRLVVDDFDYFSTDTAPAPLHILEGVLFIGGVQPGYVVGGKVGTKTPFNGCIADATINGRVQNLLEPYSYSTTTFGRCGSTTTTGGISPDQAQWAATPRPDVLPMPALPGASEAPPVNVAPHFHNAVLPVPEPEPEDTTVAAAPTTSTSTTTARPATTTTRRPPPKPEPGCALAYDHSYTTGDPDVGYRFGTRNDSRIEYSKLPGRHMQGFDLTIAFRTFDQHGGLVFYAAAEKDPSQFLAFYMKDARLHFTFNCGGATALISSTQTYNDTEWHTVTLTRSEGHGKLAVDSELVGATSAICGTPTPLAPPFYYGGLRALSPQISSNLKGFYQPFKGCLKGLMMNGQQVSDEASYHVNSLRCTDNVEEGVYFGPSTSLSDSNYLKLLEKFNVGDEVSISMEIRPRNSTGLLLSVTGKKHYLILELLENEVVATVDNGHGPFRASYSLGNNKFALCDGNWHKIHVVKSLYVVSVGVDGHFSKPGLGRGSSTQTQSALYIGGGLTRYLSRVHGKRSQRGFTGCIKNIVIGESPIKIPITAAYRNTHVGVCPVD